MCRVRGCTRSPPLTHRITNGVVVRNQVRSSVEEEWADAKRSILTPAPHPADFVPVCVEIWATKTTVSPHRCPSTGDESVATISPYLPNSSSLVCKTPDGSWSTRWTCATPWQCRMTHSDPPCSRNRPRSSRAGWGFGGMRNF